MNNINYKIKMTKNFKIFNSHLYYFNNVISNNSWNISNEYFQFNLKYKLFTNNICKRLNAGNVKIYKESLDDYDEEEYYHYYYKKKVSNQFLFYTKKISF